MIKERLIQVLEKQGIPKENFCKKIGMTSANFRGVQKKTTLNSNAIDNILSEISELNPMWLISGKGEMLIENEEKSIAPTESRVGIPLIPLDAMAGFGNGSAQVMDYDTDRYVVPEFTELDVDYMIRVKGSSMYPKYNSGDIVACKKLSLTDMFFQWNKVYVLDTEQGALVKRIKPGKDDEHILLKSDNESYDPIQLHRSRINAIALVVGVIRLE